MLRRLSDLAQMQQTGFVIGEVFSACKFLANRAFKHYIFLYQSKKET